MKVLRSVLLVLAASVVAYAQNAALMPVPKMQFFDSNGYPLAGGLVYTCSAGSSCPGTPLATYTDSSAGTPNANPIVLDAGGFASIWISGSSYKIVAQNSLGVTQWSQDNVSSTALATSGSITGSNGAALIKYTAAGSGTVSRTVAARLDDYVDVKNFGAVMDGTTNDAAALQACVNSTGKTCHIPTGTLKFATTISLALTSDSAASIECESHNSVLAFSGTGDAFAALGSGQNVPGLQIKNCTINGTSATGTANGLHLRAFQGGHIENNFIYGFSGGDALLNEGANSVTFLNDTFATSKNGVHNVGVVVAAANYSANANLFLGGVIENNSHWGVWEDAALGSTVGPNEKNVYQGVVFETNGTVSTSSGQVWFQDCDNCELSGSYLETAYGVAAAPWMVVLGGTATDGFTGGNIATYQQGNAIHNNFFGSYAIPTIKVLSGLAWYVKDNADLSAPTYFLDFSTASSTQQTQGIVTGNQVSPTISYMVGTDVSGTLITDRYVAGVSNAQGPTIYGTGFGIISSIQPNTGVTVRPNASSAPAFDFRVFDHTGSTQFQTLDNGQYQWSFTGGGSFVTAGVPTATRTITYPDASGNVMLGFGGNAGTGTVGSISSQSVNSGVCVDTGNVTISGFAVGMGISATPNADPGPWFVQKQIHGGSNVFKIQECNMSASSQTINAVSFFVRILQ